MTHASESSMTGSQGWRSLAAVSVIASIAAVACAAVVTARAFLGPHLLPAARDYLWRVPRMVAWLWPTLGAAAFGTGMSVAALRSPSTPRPLARVSLALCIGGLVLALLSMLALPVRTHMTEDARRAQCISHIHHLNLALQMYVTDWARYPEAARWCDVMLEYVPDRTTFRCPEASGECGYAYNTALDRKPPASGTHYLAAIFESDRGWNAHGGRDLLPPFPRHSGSDAIAFAGGARSMGLTERRQRKRPEGEVRWDTTWPRRYEQGVEWLVTTKDRTR